MNLEQEMKEALDGKFFTFSPFTQEVKTKKVSKDYIPSHRPNGMYDEETMKPKGRKWTDEEDALLFKMWENGYSFKEMAKAIGGSTSAINVRWQEICLMRGIQPKRHNLNEKFPPDVYQKVGYLKVVKNMTLRQIARETGMTVNQIAGIWRRYKVNNDLMDEAA